jgi:hypothetical protein
LCSQDPKCVGGMGDTPTVILKHGAGGKAFAQILTRAFKLSHQLSMHPGHLSLLSAKKRKSQFPPLSTRLPLLG